MREYYVHLPAAYLFLGTFFLFSSTFPGSETFMPGVFTRGIHLIRILSNVTGCEEYWTQLTAVGTQIRLVTAKHSV